MCYCPEDCFDDCCCSLWSKAYFFSIWTLIHGIIFTIAMLGYIAYLYAEDIFLYIGAGLLIIALVHLIAGILLLVGFLKNKRTMFLVGIILSSILPFVFVGLIYLPIIQVIFIIIACRYYKMKM
ncbi:uncharacterized protein Dvir_GJ27105 [Drosophila virilis]|uniref:Uncharacterized protein n=1 Tax=Drosophila virilis TaxID=7244 RepID=A0A0Q9W059_DROVI|nr:uncharacterized protein LOC26531875 [Drosophila virilis]KRF78505.1 uncharacterized protein Dvir_GJ27105 [Drosophila virilis]